MSDLHSLTEHDIRRWVGDTTFHRSNPYVPGAIINGRRVASDEVGTGRLKAQCIGSSPQPYYVWVTPTEDSITTAESSCPIGDGGHCKHVAALLRTWLADPDSFLAVEDLDAALERREKAELIALMRLMIERCPDLELLLELPQQSHDSAPVDPQIPTHAGPTMTH